MVLGFALVVILALSAVLSYVSVRKEQRKRGQVKQVQEKLAKGRVIFYSDSSSL